MHFWTCHDLMITGKLIRSETNTQILGYLHFCGRLSRFVCFPNWLQIPSAPVLLLDQKSSTSHFWWHEKNLFSRTAFSKTHSQTQRMHSWIAYDLRKVRKLLRSQTNSQISSNLYLMRAVNRQPCLPRGMTRRPPSSSRISIPACDIPDSAIAQHDVDDTNKLVRAVNRQPLFTARDDS